SLDPQPAERQVDQPPARAQEGRHRGVEEPRPPAVAAGVQRVGGGTDEHGPGRSRQGKGRGEHDHGHGDPQVGTQVTLAQRDPCDAHDGEGEHDHGVEAPVAPRAAPFPPADDRGDAREGEDVDVDGHRRGADAPASAPRRDAVVRQSSQETTSMTLPPKEESRATRSWYMSGILSSMSWGTSRRRRRPGGPYANFRTGRPGVLTGSVRPGGS